jgi:hypothetical protein
MNTSAPTMITADQISDFTAKHRLGDSVDQEICRALRFWLDSGDSVTLEDAMGLAATFRSSRRRLERDRLYGELRDQVCPHLFGEPAARAVLAAIDRARSRHSGRRADDPAQRLLALGACGEPILGVESLRKLPSFAAGKMKLRKYQTTGR